MVLVLHFIIIRQLCASVGSTTNGLEPFFGEFFFGHSGRRDGTRRFGPTKVKSSPCFFGRASLNDSYELPGTRISSSRPREEKQGLSSFSILACSIFHACAIRRPHVPKNCNFNCWDAHTLTPHGSKSIFDGLCCVGPGWVGWGPGGSGWVGWAFPASHQLPLLTEVTNVHERESMRVARGINVCSRVFQMKAFHGAESNRGAVFLLAESNTSCGAVRRGFWWLTVVPSGAVL